jgi:hypothetical protein
VSPLFRRGERPGPPPDLRSEILHADPSTLGFALSVDQPVWGAVMDMVFTGGAASLVSLADGTTSLYTSTGGGVIGGGAHQSVVEATHVFLDAVGQHLAEFAATDADDLPTPGTVRFHALGFGARQRVDAPEADLQTREHPLWPLYYTGHDVITALRIATEGDRP